MAPITFFTCEENDTFNQVPQVLNLTFFFKLKNVSKKRFVALDTSVQDYVESLERKNTKEKTKRDVKLLEEVLRNEKSDKREVHTK